MSDPRETTDHAPPQGDRARASLRGWFRDKPATDRVLGVLMLASGVVWLGTFAGSCVVPFPHNGTVILAAGVVCLVCWLVLTLRA